MHPPRARRHQHGAGLTHQPHPQLAWLERQAGPPLKFALIVNEQITEQSLGHRLGAVVTGAFGANDARSPEGVELGNDPGVGERHQGYGRGDRRQPQHRGSGGQERDRV